MFQIRQEVSSDIGTINALLDAGFGADRRTRTVYRLRQGAPAEGLGFVAADPVSDEPLATIRFWEIALGEQGKTGPATLLLGPLAVHPELRGQGLGRALVSHGLTVAREQGWQLCVVSGEPEYYAAYDFEDAAPYGLMMPGPLHAGWLQIKAFDPMALSTLAPGPHRIGAVPLADRRCVRYPVSALPPVISGFGIYTKTAATRLA
jgi:predicted N-acetyltransferase YhbS